MVFQYRAGADAATSGNTMALISTGLDLDLAAVSHSPFSIPDTDFGPMQDVAYSPSGDFNYPTASRSLLSWQSGIPDSLSQYDILDSIFDTPAFMSFREKCTFLNGIFNSYLGPDLTTAQNLETISKRAGLSMEEVLGWLSDEKERRSRHFANDERQSGSRFPLSPTRTKTPGPQSIFSLDVSQYSSPGTLSHSDHMLSPKESTSGSEVFVDVGALHMPRSAIPAKARRGRPAKSRLLGSSNTSSHDANRQKCLTKYPCPDCDNILTSNRWSEHVKRVHFPEHVWECPKVNPRTRKVCGSKPFSRPDNFGTHLRGEHSCGVEEISRLKSACKFRTVDLFHQICGFCDETLETRDESIEHVKDHFRVISETSNPPTDMGLSEWKEKCKSNHRLKRGVHYNKNDGASHDVQDGRPKDDDDAGPGQGNPGSQYPGGLKDQSSKEQAESSEHCIGDNGGFYSWPGSSYMDYQQHSTLGDQKSTLDGPPPEAATSGPEGHEDSRAKLVDPSILQPRSSGPVSNDMNDSLHSHPGNLQLSSRPAQSKLASDVLPVTHIPYLLPGQFTSNELPSERPGLTCMHSSATSSAVGFPYSSHSHIVPVPEWLPHGIRLNESGAGFESLGGNNEYSFNSAAVKAGGQPPYLLQHASYPYPPPRRPSIASKSTRGGGNKFTSEESKESGRCTYLHCGKVFKDLKAHMLTHQNERPQKCPIMTCDYHIKGFARKYDKMRHTLTHYKGTMTCGFCPASEEKSFNRADVFKRHLTSVHAVEQTPPNSHRKSARSTVKTLSNNASDVTAKCSTCDSIFSNAQDFYDHLDDCVLRIVQQEEPSEASNSCRLAEVEQNLAVHRTLCSQAIPTTTANHNGEHDSGNEVDEDNDEGLEGRNSADFSLRKTKLISKVRTKRKYYPSSWESPSLTKNTKKRVPCVFEGPRRLWKDDLMLDTDDDARRGIQNGNPYVTDLDIQAIGLAKSLHTGHEKDPWVADDLDGYDLEVCRKPREIIRSRKSEFAEFLVA